MHARADDGLAQALRPQPGLDGGQDLVVRQREARDLRAAEPGDLDRPHPPSLDRGPLSKPV